MIGRTLFLATALLGSGWTALAAAQGETPAELRVTDVLRRAIDAGTRPGDLTAQLVALGPEAHPDLLGLLADGLPAVVPDEGAGRPISLRNRLAIQFALADSLPDLRSSLDRWIGAGHEPHRRIEALALLGLFGGREDVPRLLALGAGPAGPRTPAIVRSALDKALESVVRRDPEAVPALARNFLEAPEHLRPSIVKSIAIPRTPAAFDTLTGLLGLSPGMDASVLLTLDRMASGMEGAIPRNSVARVRACLASDRPDVLRLATEVVATLHDHGAITDLIRLLDHDDETVRREAHAVLQRLTHTLLRPARDDWSAWYRAELDWWEQSAPRVQEQIATGSIGAARAAVREVSRHRLDPERLASLLRPALDRREPDLLALACWSLGVCGLRDVAPELVPLLDHDVEDVRRSAWDALRWLTGLHLPLDRAPWDAALGARPR